MAHFMNEISSHRGTSCIKSAYRHGNYKLIVEYYLQLKPKYISILLFYLNLIKNSNKLLPESILVEYYLNLKISFK
jgi:hypothetical protein